MEIRKLAHGIARLTHVAGLLSILLAPAVAFAQTKPLSPTGAPAGQSGASDAEIRSLIATLEGEAERGRLIAQLKTLLSAAEAERAKADDSIFASLAAPLSRLSGNLVEGAQAVLDVPNLARWVRQQVEDPARRGIWAGIVLALAITFAAGIAAEWIVRALLARPRRALKTREGSRSSGAAARSRWSEAWMRVPLFIARAFLDLFAIAAFGGAAYFAMPFVEPDGLTRDVTLAFVAANVLLRTILAIAREFLAPHGEGLRVPLISDSDANYAFVWIRRLANVGIYGAFVVHAAAVLGAPTGAVATLRLLLGLMVALLAIVLILQNRKAVASFLAGPAERPATPGVVIRRRFADLWHVAAVGYVVAVFVVWGLEIRGGFEIIWRASALTAVIVAAAVIVLRGLERLLRRALDIGDETRRRLPGFEARADRYLAIVNAVLRVIVFVVAGSAVLEAWRVDAFEWLGSAVGRRVFGGVALVTLLGLLALIVWEIASTAIERRLQAAEKDPGGAGARARTLLPLLRSIILMTLAAMVILVALSQLGLDIAPLLAGAGIVGVAVGFGAQTLVKDVITGMFILLENQIAVGDVVRVGDRSGLVEALTIRTIRLRDTNGNVYIVPFSGVTVVENMTKDYSRYVFDVSVAYREDTDQVVAVLKEIGAELAADPAFGPLILAPLEVLGIDQFAESAVVIKARITTKPIKQWDVGREFNRRMKKRFDALGIEIPFPHQTVYFGVDKLGVAPPARVHLDAEALVAPRPEEKTKPAV